MTSTERLPMPAAEARPQRREAILQSSVDEAVRLAGATGGLIFLRDEESGGLRFAVGAGIRAEQVRAWEASLRDTTDRDGILVRAMATGRTVSTGDYLADVTFGRPATGEAAARRLGIRSVVAAPLAIDAVPAGVLAVYSARVGAFGEREVALIRALADHAAAAVANAGLIEALGRSRAELARRAAAERALREIVSRFTGLTDSPALLQHVVDEANRLVGGDGGILDIVEPATGVLAWAYDATLSDRFSAAQIADYTLPIGVGLTGRAVAERRVLSAGDDLVAEFPPSPASDRFFQVTGFRSMIAAPISTEDGPLGALEVYSTRPHAFDADDLALVGALADHAAIALSAARRMEDLARSRAEVARRAEVERTLRQIAGRITALHDPAEILKQAASEAARLVDAEGATIDLLSPVGADDGVWFATGLGLDEENAPPVVDLPTAMTVGISGRALTENRAVATGDYLADRTFTHEPTRDEMIRRAGIHSMMAVPLVTDAGPVGVINIHALRRDAFGPGELTVISALADLATIAIGNARLIDELARSREELSRQADRARTLSEVAARITALREPEGILQQAAAEAARLLDGDGATIDLLAPVGSSPGLWFAVGLARHDMDDAKPMDARVALGVGLSGRALVERRALATGDYLADETFTHEAGRDESVRAEGTHSVLAAPLVTDSGALGVINVHARRRDAFGPEHLALAQVLADLATVAVTNARLISELQASEERHRRLATTSPDLIWSTDAEGRFTFVGDTSRDLLGYAPEELLGRSFATLIAPSSLDEARRRWEQIIADPMRRHLAPIALLASNGTEVATEIIAIGVVVDGTLVGVQGSTRDVRARDRLERELRRQAAEIAAGEERAHLARELHDSVTQALFSMTLTTRSAELLLERDPAAVAAQLRTLGELQRDALSEMRALIFELRPGSLERDGLVQALRTHALAVQGRTGLSVVVDCAPIDRLPLEVEDALFRIAQEALHNVVKHARARETRITLGVEGDSAEMTIEDDGVGFDPAAVPLGHLGLEGMRVRAERAGGRLDVEAAAGRGARVRAILPARPRA